MRRRILRSRRSGVVNEQPVPVAERVTVLPCHRGAGGGTHMGEEQRRAHCGAQCQQILAAPCRGHFAIDAPGSGRSARPVYQQNAEAVTIGRKFRFLGSHRPPHQRMFGLQTRSSRKPVAGIGKQSALRSGAWSNTPAHTRPSLRLSCTRSGGLCSVSLLGGSLAAAAVTLAPLHAVCHHVETACKWRLARGGDWPHRGCSSPHRPIGAPD